MSLNRSAPRALTFIAPLVLLACATARLPWRDPAGGQAHLALAQEVVAAIGAAALALLAWSERRALAWDGTTKLVTCLALIEVSSAMLASNRLAAVRASTIVLAALVAFVVARARGELSSYLLAVPAVAAASVVAEALGAVTGLARSGHAPGGLLGERNAAAELLVLAAPFVASRALASERAPRWAALAVLTMTVWAVVLTRTRSAWLALAVLAVLAIGLVLRGDDACRARAAQPLLAALLGVALALSLPTALAWREAHPYRATATRLLDRGSPSGRGRIAQGLTTARIALEHPALGVGPGNWSGRYLQLAAPDDPSLRDAPMATGRVPQSDLLGYAAERGLAGVALALALALTIASGRDDRRWLRRATLVAVGVVGAFDAAVQLAPHALLVAWTLGAAMPAAPMSRSAPRSAWLVAPAALAVAAGVACLRAAAFYFFARAHGLEDYERAARLDPGDLGQRLSIAQAYGDAGRCADARRELDAVRAYATLGPRAECIVAACEARVSPSGGR